MSMRDTVFNFEIEGSPDLRVTQFRGQESISDLFRFDIDLVSSDPDIDFDSIFNRPARLVIKDAEQERTFPGVVSTFEQVDADAHTANYRAALVPRLWLLTLNQRSWIYQEQTVPEILESVLKDHNFTSRDYDMRLTRSYVTREYVVQYQETDFNFVSRWLEHEGIFYFIHKDKVVFTDNSAVADPIDGEAAVIFAPSAGLESAGTQSIWTVAVRQQMMPAGVVLKDYNWRKPQLDLKAQSKAADGGSGQVMEYGNHYKDDAEARRLAQTRAEEIRCRQRSVEGNSNCWRFGAGFSFSIADHPATKLNRKYLLTGVDHFGSQMGAVDASGADGTQTAGVEYSNRFMCMASGVAYRPLRKTPKPKVTGTLNAKVDGSGDGSYAEIDDQGRYKVILPFDMTGKGDGKASRYIRMAQPYAGAEYGMHFPLHKGVEVIWTCIDGDPDRPIICGAVPNPDTGSPVTAANHKTSVIRDHSGNEIVLDGLKDEQRLHLYSPKHKTKITLGNSITQYTESDQKIDIGGERLEKIGKDKHVHVVGKSLTWIEKNAHQVISGNLIEEISENHAETVSGELLLEARGGIVLRVGGSFIRIDASGIAIEGPMVNINCGNPPGPSAGEAGLVCEGPRDPKISGN